MKQHVAKGTVFVAGIEGRVVVKRFISFPRMLKNIALCFDITCTLSETVLVD